jgi:sugar phosphate isomerase/epimerase
MPPFDLAAFPFTLGVVYEEIGSDPVEVVRVVRELGLASIELNPFLGKPSEWWSDERIDRTAAILADAGIPVLVICPQAFKSVALPDRAAGFVRLDEYRAHLDMLERALALTRRFQGPAGGPVPFVRTFSFRRTDPEANGEPIGEATLDLVAAGLRSAVERAAER